jgi:glutamate-1-semialdehyde 2,1-aminomutase
VFRRGPVTSSREIWQSAPGLGRRLMLGLFARGVFLNPMGTKLYLSAAHDEQVIADFLGRFRSALADLVA